MTRRDLQNQAKKTGRPWEIGKMVEKNRAPISSIVLADKDRSSEEGQDLAGSQRCAQAGVFDIDQNDLGRGQNQIAFLSQLWTVQAGDVIMTGTPAGVGACKKGDVLSGGVDGVGTIEVRVV